ncbi:hypothetical protein LshimejAT787_0804600 [Lyophyllum shimeji]|uniref:Uncharacterized protein n=1 Tax=Lyophyllum shimeji TaxID=47721 RepID=A0A9P3PSA0_LYOSH|nr:hypothetical protein LshimejAT787_0804600 [Lyophyllum shimeji]
MLKSRRWGHVLRPPGRWRRNLGRASAAGADIAKTSLVALKESADAFPPLKSAVGGVLAVWNVAERATASKKKAEAMASRCNEILEVLVDGVPDPVNIAPEMQAGIHRFTLLLQDTRRAMERRQTRTRISLVLHMNRNEDELADFNRRLDEAYKDFLIAAALRTEVKLSEMK